MAKDKYGIHSIRMLRFLHDNPGSTSGEIQKHLWEQDGDPMCWISTVRYDTAYDTGCLVRMPAWQVDTYRNASWCKNFELIETKQDSMQKLKRGRFSYLLSPYYNRALSADRVGQRPHPNSPQRWNRRWFYRESGDDGRFRYYITVKGLAWLHNENPIDEWKHII